MEGDVIRMTDKKRQKPELLAPAGSINVFENAVEAGADAVYIGAPALNARALSQDFTFAEIGAMVQFAHERGVKLYLAANSLLKEDEIPRAIETLAMLEELQPDALIIQDLGIYNLCRRYFPGLRLHASTLMGAHNSLAVRQFATMGFERVVLARELAIKEINIVAKESPVELEVFVHGALCFSYSGLCLFSSYLGGKSGLRGRCVQPCRRLYRWNSKEHRPGYFFSMNDLNSIDLVHKLAKIGISSLKIEGRLRSSHYVTSVVKAYRMVIDATVGDQETLKNAEDLLEHAMGRKTSRGYFSSPQAGDLITPDHSGNIGLYLGRVGKTVGKNRVSLTIRQSLQTGDRLRLHQEKTGERIGFTLRQLLKNGQKTARADRGDNVAIEVPAQVKRGDSLFKVDSRAAREAEKQRSSLVPERFENIIKKRQNKIEQKTASIRKNLTPATCRKRRAALSSGKRVRKFAVTGLSLYIKIDDLQSLKLRLPIIPELFLVELNRRTYSDLYRMKKIVKKFQHKIVWSLPPVILETELEFFKKAAKELIGKNFKTWQVAHISQFQLFTGKDRVNLLGDYHLNILNSQGLAVLDSFHIKRTQVAVEIDKKSLMGLAGSRSAVRSMIDLGLTLYGTVPLFTARSMADHFQYDQPFISPKGETFVLRKAYQSTIALAENPFSLLSRLSELARIGLKYGIIDLCHHKIERRELDEIGRELAGKGARKKLSTFNYFGELL